jgi:hypothetical protein
MNNRLAKELSATLRRKRSSLLLQEIVGSQNEVEPTLEDRESELVWKVASQSAVRYCCGKSMRL